MNSDREIIAGRSVRTNKAGHIHMTRLMHGKRCLHMMIVCMTAVILSAVCTVTAKADNSTESDESQEASGKSGITISYSMDEETETADDGKIVANSDYQRPKITVDGSAELSKKMTENTKKIHQMFEIEKYRVFNKAQEDYAEPKEDKKSKSVFCSYNLSQYFQTGRIDDEVVSLCACRSSYTGDEHGDYVYTGYNYDAKDGRTLGLADITDDIYGLKNVCASEIRRQCKIMGISDRYTKAAGSLVNDGSWYFTKAGICFTADPYQIAPYSYGAPKFTVSYETLDDNIKEKYRYNGGLVISALPGDTITTDLNGDGKDDELLFSMGNESGDVTTDTENSDLADEDSSDLTDAESSTLDDESDSGEMRFTINGKDFLNVVNRADENAADMELKNFYALDLDVSDKFTDIAAVFYGMDDEVYTMFLRYDGKNVRCLGEVADELFDNSCTVDGKGNVKAAEQVSLLESSSAIYTYELDGDKLKKMKQDMYPVDYSTISEEYSRHKILKEFTVYTDKSRRSTKKTLKPDDGYVSFPETDDEHWVGIRTSDGKEYYMYMSDFSTIETEDGQEDSADIFDNLYLAG